MSNILPKFCQPTLSDVYAGLEDASEGHGAGLAYHARLSAAPSGRPQQAEILVYDDVPALQKGI